MPVYNHMNLFYLPDLSQSEVKIEINESVIGRIRVGQPVRVRVEGLPGRVLEGHVKSVDQLALEPKRWWLSRDIRNFSAVIAIHNAPRGVLPGMNAEVAIDCDVRPSALVVPSTAVTYEQGRGFVYVLDQERLERRVVDVAPGDEWDVEVRSGLTEGEVVILDAESLDPSEALAAETTEGPSSRHVGSQTSDARLYSAP
jgi:multidrug efflux pump subunit AcrA (membrane-fusion protein)